MPGTRAPGRPSIDLFGKYLAQADDQTGIQAELIDRRVRIDIPAASIVAEIKAAAGPINRSQ